MATSISDQQIFTALDTYLKVIIPGVEIVQAQDNFVPMPIAPFILINNVSQRRLTWPVESYFDPVITVGNITYTIPTEYIIQLDFVGNNAASQASAVFATFTTNYVYQLFPSGIKPLYAQDARQMPLIDGETNYNQRWMLDVHIQYNPDLALPQEYFSNLGELTTDVIIEGA